MSATATMPVRAPRRRIGPDGISSTHVAEVQRARLLAGAVAAIERYGYPRTTVTEITAAARVSRRTFYELFSDREDCIRAALEDAIERVRTQIADLALGDLCWCEQMRDGLWAILCFLDSEPALARVCVVQSARGGPSLLAMRGRLTSELALLIDEGRAEGSNPKDCPPLTAEGLAGAVLSILGSRLASSRRTDAQPLTALHGELMAMIVLPYLGPAAARAERTRPAPACPPSWGARGASEAGCSEGHDAGGGDPLAGISMRLTYRTVCVLEAVALQPGASNRQVGERAGVTDQGQISKLLSRLQRYGLLENTGLQGKGEANAWQLTPTGLRVATVAGLGVVDHTDQSSPPRGTSRGASQ